MSEFWLKKMRTYFQRIDFDKDGAITRKDFEGMADRFIEQCKMDKAKADDLRKTLTAVWDKYITAVESGSQAITQDHFIEGMKKLVKDPSLKDTMAGPLPLFFHAVDSDCDGNISGSEFETFFRILGLDPTLATASFKAIDTNNDGLLSQDEFVTAGVDFFVSEKEDDPHRLFWGPLV